MTETTHDEQPNICVLIDFENIAVSAEQVDQEFDLTPVMELLKTRGRLAIRRAYGDWATKIRPHTTSRHHSFFKKI